MGLSFCYTPTGQTTHSKWDTSRSVKNYQIGLGNWKTLKAFERN